MYERVFWFPPDHRGSNENAHKRPVTATTYSCNVDSNVVVCASHRFKSILFFFTDFNTWNSNGLSVNILPNARPLTAASSCYAYIYHYHIIRYILYYYIVCVCEGGGILSYNGSLFARHYRTASIGRYVPPLFIVVPGAVPL